MVLVMGGAARCCVGNGCAMHGEIMRARRELLCRERIMACLPGVDGSFQGPEGMSRALSSLQVMSHEWSLLMMVLSVVSFRERCLFLLSH
jgi:hypothetical protein